MALSSGLARGTLTFDPHDRPKQRFFDALRAFLPARYRRDVPAVHTQVTSNSRVKAPIEFGPAKLRLQRDIREGDVVTLHTTECIQPVVREVKDFLRAGAKLAKPQWPAEIEALKKKLGLSGTAFAQRIGASPMSMSYWLRGQQTPSPEFLIRMGNLAGDPQCWFFWEMAGLSRTDVARVMPELEQRLYRHDAGVEIEVVSAAKMKKRPDAVGIPLLKDSGAAGSPRLISQGDVEDILIVPRKLCPHPEDTTCIRISGDSMSPVLKEGYIVAIDAAQREPKKLVEKMVAASDREGGTTVKWLRYTDGEYMLVAEHTSPRFPPVILSKHREWKVIGKVVWCLFQAP